MTATETESKNEDPWRLRPSVALLILAGLAAAMVFSSATHHMASMQAGDRARSLALAEAAAALILLELDTDPVGPVSTYTKVGNTYQRRYTPFEAGDGQALVELSYTLRDGTPVAFSDPPVEIYDRLRVRVTGIRPRAERTDVPLAFAHDVDAAIQAERSEKKHIFLDFETDGCGPCKQMDKWVYTADDVVAAARESSASRSMATSART